eukprot:scaffold25467_cov112-Isochrysis_galbana.AAC.4
MPHRTTLSRFAALRDDASQVSITSNSLRESRRHPLHQMARPQWRLSRRHAGTDPVKVGSCHDAGHEAASTPSRAGHAIWAVRTCRASPDP